MQAKLRRSHGSFKVEYECASGSGYIFLSELGDVGEVYVVVHGTGDFHIEDATNHTDTVEMRTK